MTVEVVVAGGSARGSSVAERRSHARSTFDGGYLPCGLSYVRRRFRVISRHATAAEALAASDDPTCETCRRALEEASRG